MPVPTPEQINGYEMAPSSIMAMLERMMNEIYLQQIERIKHALALIV